MAKKKRPAKKWDKPCTRRGFVDICKKMKTWEGKYGFKGVRWAVNKYVEMRSQTMWRQKRMKELDTELADLKAKEVF